MGSPPTPFQVSPSWTIGHLKSVAYPSEVAANKLIRLIYLGRVLPDSASLREVGVEEGHCLHAHITDKVTEGPTASTSSSYPSSSPPSYQLSSNGPPPASPDSPYSPSDTPPPEFVHSAEGQAIPLSLYSLPPPEEGTSRDFLFGYLLGLVLGFLACLWLWNSAAPRKQRVGILLGVMTNVLIGGMSGGVRESQREQQQRGAGGGTPSTDSPSP